MNHQTFTRYAAQVARRAANWTHDCMTSGREADGLIEAATAKRFCDDIKEVLSWIETETR